jgi:hypothetical protein
VVEEVMGREVAKSLNTFGDGGYQMQDSWGTCGYQSKENCSYEDENQYEESPCTITLSCDSNDKSVEIDSMITEPLMIWDLEHDGVFEEV